MELVRPINRGACGRVDEVYVDGESYARKTFDPLGPLFVDRKKALARFLREVKIQKQLGHPNIMPIVTFAEDADEPWYLMPLAAESFDKHLERERKAMTVTLQPLLDILSGLEEIHRMGYVHRDLKPKNVLRVADAWVLSDFGMATDPEARSTLTSESSMLGTEFYMAPELALAGGHSATSRSDIFSFGVLLYELAATIRKRVPYEQADGQGMLGAIMAKCTARDPKDRFQTVGAVRSALLLATEEVTAQQLVAGPQLDTIREKLSTDAEAMTQGEWEEVVSVVEGLLDDDRPPFGSDPYLLAKVIDTAQLQALHSLDPDLFNRAARAINAWATRYDFGFTFCDTIASRLAVIVKLGGVAAQSGAILAALALGATHNRWYVMRQFVRFAGADLAPDVVDRLVVDIIAGGKSLADNFDSVCFAIEDQRAALHPKVRRALEHAAE